MSTVLTPSNLFHGHVALQCAVCKHDLLGALAPGDSNRTSAIVVILKEYDENKPQDGAGERILAVETCCKGACDERLKANLARQFPKSLDAWIDLDELLIPFRNLKEWVGIVKGLHAGDHYEGRSLENLLEILRKTAPFVTRNTTPGEQEIQARLGQLDDLGL